MSKSTIDPGRSPTTRRRPSARAVTQDIKTVAYVKNVDPVNTLFARIIRAVLPWQRFFRRLGQLVFVHPERDLVLVGPSNLPGLLSAKLEILHYVKTKDKDRRLGWKLLTLDHAAAFLQSPKVLAQFPNLSCYTLSPLFDGNWKLVATPGYHASSGIYYAGSPIRPLRGTDRLTRVLSEFCWKSEVDRVNYVGMLITGVTILHWLGTHAIAVFSANQPRLGKTLLARILGLILHGTCLSVSYNPNDEEFEKHLATRAEAGDRVILIDNAKRTLRCPEINSPVLERSITDPTLNFRRLGSNTSIRRPNDVIFGLTMNEAKLSPDLRQRSVPINLEYLGNVRAREFSVPNMENYVMANRLDLVGEILGVVDRWVRAGYPMPDRPARHSIGPAWAATVDAILRHSGFLGFVENFDESEHDFDTDFQVMTDICEAFHDQPPMTATEWATHLANSNILNDRLVNEMGLTKAVRAQATIIGSLFTKFVRTTFETAIGTYRLNSTSKGKSHVSTTYWFQKVSDKAEASGDGLPGVANRLGT